VEFKVKITECANKPPKNRPMPYCKHCGTELQTDAKFCPKCGAAVEVQASTTAAPTAQAKSGPTLAFWGERFVAWLIDIIIVGIVVGVIGFFTWFSFNSFHWGQNWWGSWFIFGPFFSLGSVAHFLYWTLMEGTNGQSVGKMAMHLKVTNLNGTKITMGQAALETLGKAFLLPIDLILGWILYPGSRQRLFSYLSRTIVVRD
jgi:uncharacterized RDD family membrane protein YckC